MMAADGAGEDGADRDGSMERRAARGNWGSGSDVELALLEENAKRMSRLARPPASPLLTTHGRAARSPSAVHRGLRLATHSTPGGNIDAAWADFHSR